MPWGLLLNPLSRGAAGKSKKKGKAMAKKKKKRAAKSKAKRRGTAKRTVKRTVTKVRKTKKRAKKKAKRAAPKRTAPKRTATKRKATKRKATKSKAKPRKRKKMTEAQRRASRARSRKKYKAAQKKKRQKTEAYKTWKKKRGTGWKEKWQAGMRRSAPGYLAKLREGIAAVNPFGESKSKSKRKSTRKRRVYRKGNPVAKKKSSRRKAGKKKRKSTRKYTKRRRNPMKVGTTLKRMVTNKSALKQYGYVTVGVVSGAVVPNLITKAVTRFAPSLPIDNAVGRAAVGVAGSLLAGLLTEMVTKSSEKGQLVAAGGIASVVGSLAIEQINRYMPGVAGFGSLGATDDEVRAVVEGEIRKELGLSGMGEYVTQSELTGMGDYVTAPMVDNAGTAAGLGLETADDVDEVDTFEGGSF